jgi:hypothetical protein
MCLFLASYFVNYFLPSSFMEVKDINNAILFLKAGSFITMEFTCCIRGGGLVCFGKAIFFII